LVKASLRGFVSVELPNGLAIREMPLLVGKNGPWVSLAAKPQIDGGGQVRREPNGKIAYAAILQWRSKELADRFLRAVIDVLLTHHPRALRRRVRAMSTLAAALEYHRRGWAVVPIPARSKAPKAAGWDKRAFRVEELGRAFGAGDNIGIVLGPRSAGLVDVDLDCAEALALADVYLPPTQAVFGRVSKPRSRRLYQAQGATYEAFADPGAGDVLLELRAQGKDGGAHQTVVPPSLHPSGEPIGWTDEVVVPAPIDAALLRRRAAYLAIACLVARHISATTARSPGPDLPLLLWEADRKLGQAAFRWLDEREPDAHGNIRDRARN